MSQRWNVRSLTLATALVSALFMLLLGVAGNLGVYMGAVRMMEDWHQFFSLTVTGIIAGMVEGAFWGGLLAGFFGALYNRLLPSVPGHGR